MQANDSGTGSGQRTFTEIARRAQIVQAAIETIAEVGYVRASFAQIANRAGLSSTGLISYHFAGKDELIGEIVGQIVGEMGRFMAERMQVASVPREQLQAYIEGNVEFIATHRTEMKALLDVFMNGGFHYATASEQTALSPIEDILCAGQASGEFRHFDTKVMATLVQRAIEGLPFLLAAEPNLDIDAYGSEVVTVFDLATRVAR